MTDNISVDDLRAVIREETPKLVRQIVREEISGIKEDVSGLKTDVSSLKEDVSGLKTDVSSLKEDVSGLKTDVSSLKEDVSGLKTDVSSLKEDVSGLKADVSGLRADVSSLQEDQRKQGVKLEVMEGKLDTALENLSQNLDVKKQVDDHEQRLTGVEAQQNLLSSTVKLHSQQLEAA